MTGMGGSRLGAVCEAPGCMAEPVTRTFEGGGAGLCSEHAAGLGGQASPDNALLAPAPVGGTKEAPLWGAVHNESGRGLQRELGGSELNAHFVFTLAEELGANRRPQKKKATGKKRVRNVCEHPGCPIQPIFGFVRKRPRWCLAHRMEGAGDVWNTRKKCEVEGCTRQATVGPRGERIGSRIARRCGAHGRPLGWRPRSEWLKLAEQPESVAPPCTRNQGEASPATCLPCKKPGLKVPAPGDGGAERRDEAGKKLESGQLTHRLDRLFEVVAQTYANDAIGAGNADDAPPSAPGGAARKGSSGSDVRAAEASPGCEPGDGFSRTLMKQPLISSPNREPRQRGATAKATAKAGKQAAPVDSQENLPQRSGSSSDSADELLELLCDSSAFRLPDKWQAELTEVGFRLQAYKGQRSRRAPATPATPEAADSVVCLPSTVVAAGASASVPTARVLALG